jgi:nucleoporin SEH1
MGRSYQLIATACKDHVVRIFKLTEISATQANTPQTPQARNPSQAKLGSSPSASPNPSQSGKRYKVEVLASFDDHQAEVE